MNTKMREKNKNKNKNKINCSPFIREMHSHDISFAAKIIAL